MQSLFAWYQGVGRGGVGMCNPTSTGMLGGALQGHFEGGGVQTALFMVSYFLLKVTNRHSEWLTRQSKSSEKETNKIKS
jgi:hypothetical protein